MRKFNKNEQQIIKELSKIEIYQKTTDFIEENIFSGEKEKNWAIVYKEKNYWLCLEPHIYQDESQRKLSIVRLNEILRLFEYLITNKYIDVIHFYFEEKLDKIEILYKKKINMDVNNIVFYPFNPLIIKDTNDNVILLGQDVTEVQRELIERYFKYSIIPSEELKQLVKNNFKTEGEKSLMLTKIAMRASIIVTLIVGIVSCIFSYKQLQYAKVGSTSDNIDSLYARTARHLNSLHKDFLQEQLKLKSETIHNTVNAKVVNIQTK